MKKRSMFLIILITIFVIVGTIFAIDCYRMNKKLPGLFSAWGKKYCPIEKIDYLSTGTAEYLFNLKTKYIGDNSAVGKLLDALNIRNYGHYTFELKTDNEPYVLLINYSLIEGWGSILNNPKTVIDTSAILLSLIDNASEVHWKLPDNEVKKITTSDLFYDYGNIKDYGKSVADFKQLLIKLKYYEENDPITIGISKLTNTELTMTIDNHTDNKYSFGEPYSLQKKENGKWNEVKPIKDSCAFTMIGYTLGKTVETKTINWEYCYGKLPQGQYRITKDFTHIKSDSSIELKFGKTYYISAEFTIK